MSALYFGFELIATFAEAFIILYAISCLFDSKFSEKKQLFYEIVSLIIIGSLTAVFNYMETSYKDIWDVGIIGAYIIVCFLLYKGNIFLRIVIPLLIMIIILIINITTDVFISRLYDVPPEYLLQSGSSLRLLSLFITKFSFFLIIQLLIKIVRKNDYDLKSDEWSGITLLFLISAIILFVAAEIQYNKVDDNFSMIFLTSGIAAINICVFILIKKMAVKNKQLTILQVLNTQHEEQIKSLRSIALIYTSMNILKHDMKNEWLIVYNALEKGDTMRAEELLKKMINKTDSVFEETVTLSHSSINAIVNYKLNCAKQSGIYCTSMIQDDFDSFEEYDIVMLFANLMDNAIEASKEVNSPRIDIAITTKMNYLSIVIGNKIEKSVLSVNSSLKTSKSNKEQHGFGIQSVKQIADKYYGMTDFYEQDNMFYADIMLKKATPVLDSKLPFTN